MGKSSKPLHIVIHQSLYDAAPEHWETLLAQGFTIEKLDGTEPDLILAPYAMRMTADMVQQLPTAFELAVKGARALRYAPVSTDSATWKKGKPKRASNTKRSKRKDTTQQTEAAPGGESPASPPELPADGTAQLEG